MSSASLTRPLVNGAVINNYVGKQVTVIGYVSGSNPNSKNFELRSSDDQTIIVTLQEPLKEPIYGLVEVIGESKGSKVILAENVIKHIGDSTGMPDMAYLNQVIMVFENRKNFWNCTANES